jgi:hypothetical protein
MTQPWSMWEPRLNDYAGYAITSGSKKVLLKGRPLAIQDIPVPFLIIQIMQCWAVSTWMDDQVTSKPDAVRRCAQITGPPGSLCKILREKNKKTE